MGSSTDANVTKIMVFHHRPDSSPSFATRHRRRRQRQRRGAARLSGRNIPLVQFLLLFLLLLDCHVVDAQLGRCIEFDVTGASQQTDDDDALDGLGAISIGQPKMGCPTDLTVVDGLPTIQDVLCKFEQDSISRIFRSTKTETAATATMAGPPIYRLCPNTVYRVDGNNWLTAVLDGTVYTCGNNGDVDDDGCIVEGGVPQVILKDNPPEVSALNNDDGNPLLLRTVRFEGITFRGATGTSILATGGANLTAEFVNCRWETSEQAILQGYLPYRRRHRQLHGRRTTFPATTLMHGGGSQEHRRRMESNETGIVPELSSSWHHLESNDRRRDRRRRMMEDVAYEALSSTMMYDAIFESITTLARKMTTESATTTMLGDLPPYISSVRSRRENASLSGGGVSDGDSIRRRLQQDLSPQLGMKTILKGCTIESSPGNTTSSPDISISGGSMEIYGSHFLHGQRDLTFVASDGARVLLKNTNITNSNVLVFLFQFGGEAVIDGCLFHSNNATLEIAAYGDATVSMIDSCVINGTYESIFFGTATSSTESTKDSNYIDSTSKVTKCSGLFRENGTNCLDDGGDCSGECFPFEADACSANSPTPSPSGSPTMASSMSPSSVPRDNGEWNGTGSVNIGPPTPDSSGGSTKGRIHSAVHHILYVVPTITMALWMSIMGEASG